MKKSRGRTRIFGRYRWIWSRRRNTQIYFGWRYKEKKYWLKN